MKSLRLFTFLLGAALQTSAALATPNYTLPYGTWGSAGGRANDEYAFTRLGMTVGQSVAGVAFGLGASCADNVGFWHWGFLPVLDVGGDCVGAISVFRLYPCAPNPFGLETTIRYAIPASSAPVEVRLRLYDVSGRLVRLLDGRLRGAGVHTITWDGRDEYGRLLSEGVYFCCVEAGAFQATRRLALIR